MTPTDPSPAPEFADEVDSALASLWRGDSAALERLIGDEPDAAEAASRERGQGVGDALRAAAARLSRPAPIEAPPVVPGFEIVGEIGRGGMGVVYEAIQTHPRRRVAMKVLQSSRAADRHHRLMFDREICALAALDHPDIAGLHSAGTTADGRSYFIMEFVCGQPLTEYADARALGRAARLELLCRLCDAVHHAHLRGVIHRDLKPSNVLVGEAPSASSGSSAASAEGRLKVLDFGLARLTEQGASEHSQALDGANIKGTLAYMSPEQLQGRSDLVDARSDVHALGVILHQLMTGRLPVDVADVSLPAAIRSLDRRAPSRLSRFDRSLRGDLDVIAAKAMERDLAQRYQSAAQLADDIRRHLRNEPIFARPASALYQLRKFARRNRALVTGASLALAALILGLLATTLALMQANHARDETRRAEQTAERINLFLNHMLASTDPSVTRGDDVTVNAMLDEAVRNLDAGALAGQPLAEARVRTTIADSYFSLGLYPPARSQYATALDIRRRALGEGDLEVVRSLLNLARVTTKNEEIDASERLIDEAERRSLALAGPDGEMTIRASLARTTLWIAAKRPDEARGLLCELLPRSIRVMGGEDNELVTEIKGSIGFLHGCTNDTWEGIRTLEETLDSQKRVYGPEHERLSRTLVNLGALHLDIREYDKAESLLNEALAMRRKLFGDDHPSVASALFNLSSVYFLTRRFDQAEQALRQALDIQERRLATGHYETVRTRMSLGRALSRLGKYEESERLLRAAIGEFDAKPAGLSFRGIAARRYLAECFVRQKRFAEAETALLDAWRIAQDRPGNADELKAVSAGLAGLYESWGKPEQSAKWKPPDATPEEASTTQPDGR